jgi:S1-C subfamily serine protease
LIINSRRQGEESWKVVKEQSVDPAAQQLATQIQLTQAGTHNIRVTNSQGQEIAQASLEIIDRPFSGEEIYKRLLKSTVWMITVDSRGCVGLGSGALVHRSHKLILTNYHVIKNAGSIFVSFPSYKLHNKELITQPKYYLDNFKKAGLKGEIVAKDAGHDLALVQLSSLPAHSSIVPLARQSPNVGANVYSIGASGAMDGALWRFTTGQVRQVYEKDYATASSRITSFVVETTAPINPGDSGGPVVNDRGHLVAVASSYKVTARSVSNNIDVREVRSLLLKYLSANAGEMEDLPSRSRLSDRLHRPRRPHHLPPTRRRLTSRPCSRWSTIPRPA